MKKLYAVVAFIIIAVVVVASVVPICQMISPKPVKVEEWKYAPPPRAVYTTGVFEINASHWSVEYENLWWYRGGFIEVYTESGTLVRSEGNINGVGTMDFYIRGRFYLKIHADASNSPPPMEWTVRVLEYR